MSDALQTVAVKARALLAKLDEIEPHVNNAILISTLHHCPYSGPDYAVEKDELIVALDKAQVPQPNAERIDHE